MATDKELEAAIAKQFPKGVKTTLEKFQLSFLITFNRTVRRTRKASFLLDEVIKARHRRLLKKLTREFDAARSVVTIRRQIKILEKEIERINLAAKVEIDKDVKSVGRLQRMGSLELFDEFGFDLDKREARLFLDAKGEFRKNLVISNINTLKTKKLMDETAQKGIQKANKILSEFALTKDAPENMVREIREALGQTQAQAIRTIRTEMIASANRATEDTFGEFGVKLCSWSAAFDSTTCPICLRLNGKVWRTNEPTKRRPPAHPHCVLGETEIIATDLRKAYKSIFKGPGRRVFFEGGETTVTTNHMFLTPNGFSKASSLREGDTILYDIEAERVASVSTNDDRKPITAEEIFDSLLVSGEVPSVEVPATSKDLYGDGAFIEGNIDIIGSDSFLLNEILSEFSEEIAEQNFVIPNVSMPLFSAHSGLTFRLKRLLGSFNLRMSGRRESFFFRRREFCHPDKIRLASGPLLHPTLYKPTHDGRSGYAQAIRDRQGAFPSDIGLKKIVKIEVVHIDAPVYTFETDSSLYISNGVISSNCRCTLIPVPSDELLRTESVVKNINREGEKTRSQNFIEDLSTEELIGTLGSKTKADFFRRGVPLHRIVTNRGRIKTDLEMINEFGDMSDSALKRIPKTFGRRKPILKKNN